MDNQTNPHDGQLIINAQQLKDHDLLVSLDVNVGGIKGDLKEIKDGFLSRIIAIESRLDKNDIYHASIPLSKYDNAYEWVEKIRANMWLLVIVGSIVLGMGEVIINKIVGMVFHF